MLLFEKVLDLIIKYPFVGIGTFSALIPIIIGVFNYKYFGRSSKIIFWFSVFYFLSDLPIWVTAALRLDNHKIVFTRDILITLFLAATYVPKPINLQKTRIYYILISIIVFLLFYEMAVSNFDRTYLWIPRIVLIVFTFDFYAKLLNEFKIKKIVIYPYFWYSVGILIFSMNSILILLFTKQTIHNFEDKVIHDRFVNFLESINLALFIFISIGFLVAKKNFRNLPK